MSLTAPAEMGPVNAYALYERLRPKPISTFLQQAGFRVARTLSPVFERARFAADTAAKLAAAKLEALRVSAQDFFDGLEPIDGHDDTRRTIDGRSVSLATFAFLAAATASTSFYPIGDARASKTASVTYETTLPARTYDAAPMAFEDASVLEVGPGPTAQQGAEQEIAGVDGSAYFIDSAIPLSSFEVVQLPTDLHYDESDVRGAGLDAR